MNTHSKPFSPIFLVIFLTLLISVSCHKDDADDGRKYRVIEKHFYDNEVLQRTVAYQYEGNQIAIQRDFFYSKGVDSLKAVVEYPDENTIEMERQFNFGGIWYPIDKYTIESQDGRTVRTTTFYCDGSYWDPVYMEEYQYTGEVLAEETWLYYEFGQWQNDLKITYIYNDDLITGATYYNFDADWQISGKEEAGYSGNRIRDVVGFTYSDGEYRKASKYSYHYSGDDLISIGLYEFDGYNWDSAGAVTFTYDSHKNLISEGYLNGLNSSRIEYAYEEGSGNYFRFTSPGGGLTGFSPYPKPTERSFKFSHFRLFTN